LACGPPHRPRLIPAPRFSRGFAVHGLIRAITPPGKSPSGPTMRLLFPPARLAAAVLLLALAGCGNSRNEAYIEKPVDDLYNKAMDALVDERYSEAAKTFEQVESQHPYSA